MHQPAPTLTGTFDEIEVGPGLIGRICPCVPCGDPLCDCRREPNVLFLYSEPDTDAWVAGRFLRPAEVDDLISGLDGEAIHDMAGTSILFGVSWRFFDAGDVLDTLLDHQQKAYQDTPQWYWDQPHEQLRDVRAAINEVDPLPIYHLLKLSFFVGRELGGSNGRTP